LSFIKNPAEITNLKLIKNHDFAIGFSLEPTHKEAIRLLFSTKRVLPNLGLGHGGRRTNDLIERSRIVPYLILKGSSAWHETINIVTKIARPSHSLIAWP